METSKFDGLELFYSAVDFTCFLETVIIKPPVGFSLEEWKAALYHIDRKLFSKEGLYGAFNRRDYFKIYEKLSKAVEIYLRKQSFSKENAALIENELWLDNDYLNSLKSHFIRIAEEAKSYLKTKAEMRIAENDLKMQEEQKRQEKLEWLERLLTPRGFTCVICVLFVVGYIFH